ncbi:MAG: glycosyltransferase family 4 protein [Anaerolineae bacterium]|nr:glycosyltransferase family 4 protein [Anaerolineae bacterium]
MRIFIASGIFHPEPGGPATYLYHLLPEIQARGHSITALTFGDAPTDDYPYPLTRIPRSNYITRQRAYRRAAANLWPGCDLAFVHSIGLPLPDVIHPQIGKVVGDKAWERSVNRGWVPPTSDIDRFQVERQGALAEMSKALRSQQVKRFDHVIVPSQYLKQMVIGWGIEPERVSVVYNAPHAEMPRPAENKAEARRRLSLGDGPLLLAAARLTAWKGIDHILHALADRADIRLLVAGEGPERTRLEALRSELGLENRVTFLGRVDRAVMPLYYRAADYTVLYSGYEGLSHVLLESLGIGTPVIASDKSGNPEVIEHEGNGLLVPYVDVGALIDTFRTAFEGDTCKRLAANTSPGLERFRWETLVEQTIGILERFG